MTPEDAAVARAVEEGLQALESRPVSKKRIGGAGLLWLVKLCAEDAARRAFAAGVAHERERCAKVAENVRGGFTANVRVSEEEQELVRDPDGPWVLNSHVAAAIRAGEEGR